MRRPVELRRSWLFIGGAEADALEAGPESGADVLIQELEDFCTPETRPAARRLMASTLSARREAGALATVRINPLESPDGRADLATAMAAAPDAILLPKANEPGQIVELDRRIGLLEDKHGLPAGATEIVPNIEQARGLRLTYEICRASPRVTAALVASEDMAADLGVERSRDGAALAHVRARFHVDCTAAGVLSIDMPYTWTDSAGLETDLAAARQLGYRAKAAVTGAHPGVINRMLTPTREAAEAALEIVTAFEAARARGEPRVEVDGSLVEAPIHANAKRLLERARAFAVI